MESFSSLVELLAQRAKSQPDQRAYVFLSDRGEEETAITFRELPKKGITSKTMKCRRCSL